MSFWSTTIKPMRAEFARRFPKLFTPERTPNLKKKPLKIGIHQDLIKEFPEVNPKVIRLALFDYIQGPEYLTACFDGAPRFDLQGNESGIVTREHRLYLLKLAEDDKRRIKRQRDAQQNRTVQMARRTEAVGENLTIYET